MVLLAACLRASSPRLVNFGTTTAASTPRITSTRSSSIKLNALLVKDLFMSQSPVGWASPTASHRWWAVPTLLHQILQHEHRQQHADDDGADQAGHDEQQQRLGQGDQ